MTLSSIIFVFGFLPIFLLLYYISKERIRGYILLAGSVYFYYVTDVYRVKFIIALCIAIYMLTILMDKLKASYPFFRKAIAAAGIIGVLTVLFYYRYLNRVVGIFNSICGTNYLQERMDRSAALGISFLSFSIISYIVDCYTEKIQCQKNPFKLAMYILMFPKIIMGPIERYANIEGEIGTPAVSMDNIGIGVKRFVIGFCKKVIIADNLATLVHAIQTSDSYSSIPIANLWLGSISYSFELFFDFAGYSDMAIGIALMLGFHFSENFNYPYIASSLTDFWRRWHISLSFWFRDYVYIPLGGSRKSIARNILNLSVVWLLTGLWHGGTLNFVIWALAYFIGLVFERYVLKLKSRGKIVKTIWRVVTLFLINFNWVIFSHTSWKEGLSYCKGMLGCYGSALSDDLFIYYIREYGIYLMLAILFSMPIVPWVSNNVKRIDKVGISAVITPIILLLAFVWAISFVLLGAHNPFLYQNF